MPKPAIMAARFEKRRQAVRPTSTQAADPEDGLADADDRQVAAGDRVDHSQEVRIERRLVEDFVAEPVSGRDALRPLVVRARIAHQDRKEGRPPNLPECNSRMTKATIKIAGGDG